MKVLPRIARIAALLVFVMITFTCPAKATGTVKATYVGPVEVRSARPDTVGPFSLLMEHYNGHVEFWEAWNVSQSNVWCQHDSNFNSVHQGGRCRLGKHWERIPAIQAKELGWEEIKPNNFISLWLWDYQYTEWDELELWVKCRSDGKEFVDTLRWLRPSQSSLDSLKKIKGTLW